MHDEAENRKNPEIFCFLMYFLMKNYHFIEIMGCPGGCVAGAGTNLQVAKAQKKVKEFVAGSSKKIPSKELEEIELK